MKGRVVLVTGANGGLGTYVTRAFVDTGATVIGTSRWPASEDLMFWRTQSAVSPWPIDSGH